jgi:hypothetical protein
MTPIKMFYWENKTESLNWFYVERELDVLHKFNLKENHEKAFSF